MELLIAIAPMLIVGAIGYIVVSIQEWVADMRFYRRRTQRELERIKRSLGRVEFPTGEVEMLGPGEIYIFDKQKVGIVTDEGMGATLNEAERLIKEARDRTVD